MKKISCYLILLAFISCKKENVDDNNGNGNQQETIKEIITKSWIPKSVKENGLLVYTKGDNSSLKLGYSSFRLSLQANGNVVLDEIEGTKIVGLWRLESGDKKLRLENLNPAPSESGGILEFNIIKSSASNFEITATKSNFKTGGTLNTYELVPE